jgi:hypothetical protein
VYFFLYDIEFYSLTCDRVLLAVMLPVEPLNSFGKRQPMPRNVFERFFEAWVSALCGALVGH